MASTSDETGRQARRKAATRRAIVVAADRLFAEHGYAETTMEDIARAAHVAVRTIYLHFDSKPAILLAYFDDWLDAFVDQLCARPVEEPVSETVTAALAQLEQDGWTDRAYGEMSSPHPIVQFIGDGQLEIAGHIMHSWVRAQDRLAADFDRRGAARGGAALPRARAAAIFAAWTATVLQARAGYADGTIDRDDTGNRAGIRMMRGVEDALGGPGSAPDSRTL